MQPSFSGLFVTWAYLPKIDDFGLEKHSEMRNYKCANKTLTPNDFPALCDQSELADIDLDDCSLGDDPQSGVE